MNNSLIQHLLPTPSPTTPIPPTLHCAPTTTKIILVRHARTTFNEQGRYQGSSDESVLTAKGHQDAYATGLALKEYNFDAIYTSPLKRVQQTTQRIVAALGNKKLPVYKDRLLTEICMYHWQGYSYQEVKEKFTKAYNCWQDTPHLLRFGNSYPVLELFEQARLFWRKVFNSHRGQTILIVAHGGINRALISTASGLQPESYHSLQQSNCGISCLEFSSENNAAIKYLNTTEHLGKTLPKLKAGKTGWRWLLLSQTNINNLEKCSWFNISGSSNSIDLLLTEHSISESFAQKLATKYQIPHLPLTENHFANWQQIITNRQKSSVPIERSHLTTGLIVASDQLIAQILQQTCQVNISGIRASLAVIHYPQNANYSILQGILPLTSSLVTRTK